MDQEHAERVAADDDHRLAPTRGRFVHGVQADGERIGERRFLGLFVPAGATLTSLSYCGVMGLPASCLHYGGNGRALFAVEHRKHLSLL
jgi:hypothetical protein